MTQIVLDSEDIIISASLCPLHVNIYRKQKNTLLMTPDRKVHHPKYCTSMTALQQLKGVKLMLKKNRINELAFTFAILITYLNKVKDFKLLVLCTFT